LRFFAELSKKGFSQNQKFNSSRIAIVKAERKDFIFIISVKTFFYINLTAKAGGNRQNKIPT